MNPIPVKPILIDTSIYLKRLNILLILSSCFLSIQAQLDSVTLNLDSRVVMGEIPFDVPFYFKIGIPATTQKISAEIRYKDAKKRYYRPYRIKSKPDTCYRSIGSFTRIKSSEKNAYILCPELHPNVEYQLKLNLLDKVNFTESDEKKFANTVRAVVRKNIKTYNDLTQKKLKFIADEVETVFEKQFKKKPNEFRSLKEEPVVLDLMGQDFITFILDNVDLTFREESHESTYQDRLEFLEGGLTTKQRQKILQDLDALIKQQEKLSPLGKGLWKRGRLLDDSNYRNISLGKVVYQLKELFKKKSFLQLFKGEFKLDTKGDLTPHSQNERRDLRSIRLIYRTFQLLVKEEFTYANGKPIMQASNTVIKSTVLVLLKELVEEQQEITASQIKLDKINEKLPIDISKYYLVTTRYYELSTAPNIFVEIRKNPYFGIDLGIGYVPGLSSFFLNEGINFYLSPVNKKASIKSLQGWDYFAKRFSFYISISQYLGNNAPSTISTLFDNKDDGKGFRGNLLLGVGWRVTRIARINTGYMLTQQKNLDPFNSQNNIVGYPLINFALEFDVAQTYKDIFK